MSDEQELAKVPLYGFSNLLFALILVSLIVPLIPFTAFSGFLLKASLTILLLTSVYLFSHNRSMLILLAFLALPTLISGWLPLLSQGVFFVMVDQLTNLIFFAYIIYHIGRMIAAAKVITKDIIYASLCVYLFLGLDWSFAYSLLEALEPGSFVGLLTSKGDYFNQMAYYSFVTLTTLGYGDIHPSSPAAEALASIEAITGQFYMTVLVAHLVGSRVSQRDQEQK